MELMNEMNKGRKEGRSEGLKECRNEGMKEGMSEGMNESLDEWMNRLANEPMNEWLKWLLYILTNWLNEWLNERMNRRAILQNMPLIVVWFCRKFQSIFASLDIQLNMRSLKLMQFGYGYASTLTAPFWEGWTSISSWSSKQCTRILTIR